MAETTKPSNIVTENRPMVTLPGGLVSPDLVDLIFDYILAEFPEMAPRAGVLKEATRKEFSGDTTYIARRSAIERQNWLTRCCACSTDATPPRSRAASTSAARRCIA